MAKISKDETDKVVIATVARSVKNTVSDIKASLNEVAQMDTSIPDDLPF